MMKSKNYSLVMLSIALPLIFGLLLAQTVTGRSIDDSQNRTTTTNAQNVELLGQIGGGGLGIAVQGNYVYHTVGHSMSIVDISNSSQPTLTGQIDSLPELALDISVVGNYAYIANGNGGLRVIDISTPVNPNEISSYDSGDTFGVDVVGGYAYMSSGSIGLQIADVTNPASPQSSGTLDTPGYTLDAAISGSYAYLADGTGGLRIVDISNPSSPTEVGSFDVVSYTVGVAVAGNYAYLVDSSARALRIIDVSNPANLSEVGLLGNFSYETVPYNVAISGTLAYLAGWTGGLQIIDISNPAAPAIIGSANSLGEVYDVSVLGNFAYVTDIEGMMSVVDISNPTNPTVVGSLYQRLGVSYNAAVSGDYAFVSAGNSGVWILDIADPLKPSQASYVNTPGTAESVAIAGDYAYVADGSSGLRVLNVNNPTSPFEVGSVNTPGYAADVTVVGNYAYIADDTTMRVIDISNPAAPNEIGFYDPLNSNLRSVSVSGNYAFIVYYGGLFVIDISTPASPSLAGFYLYLGFDIEVVDNYIYIAAQDGLYIVQASFNPFSVSQATLYKPNNVFFDARSLSVFENYVYVAGSGISVIDVSIPTNPSRVGFSPAAGGSTQRIASIGNKIYLAPGLAASFSIFQFNAASRTVAPSVSETLAYTDTQGLTTTIQIPADAVTTTTTLVYAPSLTVTENPGGSFAEHAFDLTAVQNDLEQSNFSFQKPVTVTISYSDTDVAGLGEATLKLLYWNGSAWVDAATTCSPASTYGRDITNNWLSLPICRAGLFALFGTAAQKVYLPIVVR